MKKWKSVEPLVRMDTLQNIYERRAVRKYIDKPVDKKIIEQIIDAGKMAPTAMNKQSWKFYVVTSRETILRMSKEIKKVAAKDFIKSGVRQIIKMAASLLHAPSLDFFKLDDPVFYGAPVVIFITAPRDNEWGALDIGMCAQNMMLAAKSFGLDSCPVGFGKYLEHAKLYSRLNADKTEQLHLSLIFGYGDEIPEMHKRVKDNVTFVD